MKRRTMPAFYGKNIARQTQRRVLRGGKTTAQALDDHREATGNVLCMCIMAALYDRYGIGESRLQRVVDCANEFSARYASAKQVQGEERAKKALDEAVKDLLPGGFLLPAARPPKKARDWEVLAAQREAADTVFKLYIRAMHKALGFGAERIEVIARETEDNFRQFGDWAKDGDYYGYERLRRAVEQITGENVRIVDEEDNAPVFSARKY